MKEAQMGEWIAIDKWRDCQHLARPGFIFEIQNAAGQSLLTSCGPLPAPPFDWTAAPVRFRLVREAVPQRSSPIPPPRR